ncbi:MAG TPA: hypothetical protein VGM56_33970 [Byssovorax sp.]
MTSQSSAPPGRKKRLRPWYLVAAMVVTWFIGVQGLTDGLRVAAFLHHGVVPTAEDEATEDGAPPRPSAIPQLQAIADARDTTFPLAVAEALLSGLLVVASGFAMSGRKGARSLAVQAIAVNALYLVAEYALTPGIRAAWVETFARTAEALPKPNDYAIFASREFLWGLDRARLGIHLGALGLGALALTRSRTKAFFDVVARAAERAEDEP